MNMFKKFTDWLEINKPGSKKQYASAYRIINKINKTEHLMPLENWNLEKWDELYGILVAKEEFQKLNTSGHSYLTAGLSQFKKYLESSLVPTVIPPLEPFPDFKWRWASKTPTEGINTRQILFGVLNVLVKHNKKKHATQEFRDDLITLENELSSRISLSKHERALDKNIIENSGQYWKAYGLLNTTSDGTIDVSELGLKVINMNMSNELFIQWQIDNFSLPNMHIETQSVIEKFKDHDIEIKPFQLLFNVFAQIMDSKRSVNQYYITVEEVQKIVVPLSVDKYISVDIYVEHIINFRNNKLAYDSWPNYIPEANDKRMLNEYLLFLNNFGALTDYASTNGTRYYFNDMTQRLILKCVTNNSFKISNLKLENFNIDLFINSLNNANLSVSDSLPYRFVSALQTKPFVILTGLSGSGKTKLAEAFSLWISESPEQYQMVSVGADWTNREPLLGFPNALESGKYVSPDSGVLDLLLRARDDETRPYFLILDEMNMSHVERYFADFLSAMESTEGEISLHADGEEWGDCDIPSILKLPENLFIIGTVNIDETTYMFSPKVLDRANVIEFRVSDTEMENYLSEPKVLDMMLLKNQGASMGKSFVEAANSSMDMSEDLSGVLMPFFKELQKVGSEFGYRTASEIGRFVTVCTAMAENKMNEDEIIDAAVMQKLLPKLHGSRNKIEKTLGILKKLCIAESTEGDSSDKVKYPLSYEKLERMHTRVLSDGFTSFAEA